MTRTVPVLAVALALITGSTALAAQEAPQAVDLQVKSAVLLGQGKPSMRLVAMSALRGVELRLTPCSGKARTVKVGAMAEGDTREFPLDHAPGRCIWHLEVRHAGAKAAQTFDFETVVARPMEIRISKNDVDLAEGRIAFVATEVVARVTLKVLGDGGRTLVDADFPLQSDAGNVTAVRFPPQTDNVTLVKLTAYDPDGFFNGVEISPFFVEIPHEEVTFEFGKADIQALEEEKLTRTMAEIRNAIKKFGNEFQARLYVAGYTDTVGGKDYNQDLSDRRAHAIAHWFATHGLEVRACSQGFGEDALAVATPDETPEPRNRRTVHVLGNQPPPISATFPRTSWKCL
jgi:outer membrane protein OmpA-like peptidoglycan-associated protein